MAFLETRYLKPLLPRAPEQAAHVGEHVLVFVLHVPAHVADIFIEKFKDKKGHVAVFGAVDGFEQFAANGGELEGEEIFQNKGLTL